MVSKKVSRKADLPPPTSLFYENIFHLKSMITKCKELCLDKTIIGNFVISTVLVTRVQVVSILGRERHKDIVQMHKD